MRYQRLLLLLLACLGLVGCGGLQMEDPVSQPTPGSVRIGFLYNLGSGVQNYDREMSARLAAEEINAQGGVLGRPLEILANGDRMESPTGLVGARSLLEAGVVAIVGGSTSALSVATAELTVPAGVPLCAPSSTAPALSSLVVQGRLVSGDLFWRTAPSDTFQGRVLARQVLGTGVRTAAILFREDTYGRGLALTFQEAFEAGGGRLTAQVGYGATQVAGFEPQVAQALAGGVPEAVVLISFSTDGAALTRAFRTADPQPRPRFFAGDAVFNTGFLTNGDAAILEGLMGTAPTPPLGYKPYMDYLARFRARMGYEPIGNPPAAAYDAVYLFALAMEREGAVGSQAVRRHLRAVSGGLGDGGLQVGPLDWKTAVARLRAGGAVDYEGASGAIDFDARGDVTQATYLWWVVRDRTFVIQAVVD